MLEPETFRERWADRGLKLRINPPRTTWLAFPRPVHTVPRLLLATAFAILWMTDLGLVMRFGIEYEANPIARWLILHTGWFGFATVKMTILVWFLYLSPQMRTWILIAAPALMVVPVALGVLILYPI